MKLYVPIDDDRLKAGALWGSESWVHTPLHLGRECNMFHLFLAGSRGGDSIAVSHYRLAETRIRFSVIRNLWLTFFSFFFTVLRYM